MQQAQQMQKKMQDAQEKLKSSEFEGQSGGGLIKVILKGDFSAKEIFIDDSLIGKDAEKEMLEDLIVAAINDAKKKVEDGTAHTMSDAMGGMNLPKDFKMPF
jgi:DNA-binding YbaB/EbfC family protein